MVDRLRDDATEISAAAAKRLTAQFASQTRAEAIRPLATMHAADHVAGVSVRWRHGVVASVDLGADEKVVLRLADKTVTFPSSCWPALQALRSAGVFDADALRVSTPPMPPC